MGVRKKKKPGNPSREAGGSLPGQPGLQSRTAKDSQGYIEKSSLKKIERERDRDTEREEFISYPVSWKVQADS